MFVNFRGRSTYSMLEGIGTMQNIVQQAKSLWQSAISITDRNGIYGAIDFYRTTKALDIQPIIGVELPYISHRHLVESKRGVAEHLWTLTLVARNTSGYVNILHLISEAYDYAVEGFPVLDNQLLSKYCKDVFVIVGALNSYAYQAIDQNNNTDQVYQHFDEIKNIVGKDAMVVAFSTQSYSAYPSLETLDQVCLRYVGDEGIRAIATSIFYYPFEEQKEAYETALAIKDNKRAYRDDSRKIPGKHHIHSEQEIRDTLQANGHATDFVQQLIATSATLAQEIDIQLDIGQVLFPDYKVPEAIEELYHRYKDQLTQA